MAYCYGGYYTRPLVSSYCAPAPKASYSSYYCAPAAKSSVSIGSIASIASVGVSVVNAVTGLVSAIAAFCPPAKTPNYKCVPVCPHTAASAFCSTPIM